MAEGIDKNEEDVRTVREEIFSKAVRAGKRTYFFDVKATRRNDYYLTLTESKKRFNRDGRFYFEKHKIFLYKEDFEKFTEGLAEVVEFINNANPEIIEDIELVPRVEVTEKEQAEAIIEKASDAPIEESAETKDEVVVKEEEVVVKEEKEVVVKEEKEEETISDNYTSNVEFEDLDDTKEA